MAHHISAIAWKVKFPSQTQKLLILRMADFSHEDGNGIYPAVDTMATDIGCSRRQIQYAIKALEGCELIERVRDGGKTGKTNVWKINLELLVELALQEKKLEGVHDRLEVVENEGANIAPRDLLRVQSAAQRVQPIARGGATHCTQTLINPHIDPLNASADARDSSRTPPALGKPSPVKMFELTPKDITWKTWLDLMEAKGYPDLADAAIEAQKIQVKSKWPDPDEGIRGLLSPAPKKPAIDIASRMIGEGDAT